MTGPSEGNGAQVVRGTRDTNMREERGRGGGGGQGQTFCEDDRRVPRPWQDTDLWQVRRCGWGLQPLTVQTKGVVSRRTGLLLQPPFPPPASSSPSGLVAGYKTSPTHPV